MLPKKLTRSRLPAFLAEQPVCRVVLEVCASAHDWGRTVQELGRGVRLIPPVYVKPFAKRQKNDARDAGARDSPHVPSPRDSWRSSGSPHLG